MSKDIPENVLTEMNKEYNRPVELYQIFLDPGTLYLAKYPVDIDFFDENGNPVTYYAAALSRGKIETSVDTKVDQVEVLMDNVTREMSAYIANTEFAGRKMKIMKILLDASLDSIDDAIPVFSGEMDAPKINEYQMSITVVSELDTLDKDLPGRTYNVPCPWVFGEENCGAAKPTKNGTINSISNDYMTINDSSITEDDAYWEHGEITIDSESRLVTESGTGYVKVEYPFSADVEAGDSYILEAGCDKTWDAGHGCTFWDNKGFYAGFLSIPTNQNVREVS